MLLIDRRLNQSLLIDGHIEVMVCHVRGDRVKIGVQAPRQVLILRSELLDGGSDAPPAAHPVPPAAGKAGGA